MDIYKINLSFGESLHFAADLSEASATIYHVDDDTLEIGEPTQYQTADARHDETEAAWLILESCGRDYWLDPSAEITEVDDEEWIAGMRREEYIRSLIDSVETVETV